MKKLTIKTSLAAVFLFAALNIQAQLTPGFTDLGMPTGISIHSFSLKNAIAIDNQNNVWVGTQKVAPSIPTPGLLAKWSQGNWEVFTSENSGLPAETVYSLFSYEDKLYIGTSQGLAVYDGGWEVITVDDGLASNHVRSLLVNESVIIAGTHEGLSVFSNNVWTTYDTLNSGISNNRVRALTMDENGRLWIGTENGLSSFFEGTWTTYNSENSGLTAPVVRALLFDDDNNLWIGTQGEGGLFKMVDQSIYSFYDLFPLQTNVANTVASLTKDDSGNLYLAIRLGYQNNYQFLKIRNDRLIAYKSYYTGLPLSVYHNGLLWFVNSALPRNLYTFDMMQGRMFDAINRIDINNISADFTSSGRIGWDIDLHETPHFEIPKGSGKYTLFTQVPWIGGVANDTALHFAGERFAQVGRDFWFGPVSSDSVVYHQEQGKWNRVWKISKTEIDHHKNNWNSPGYQMPEVIENWPAHGDTLKGQEWFIAPFMDLNNNDIYEPHLGEYPMIRGDQALYFVSNDHRDIHTETGGNALGVEIRAMAYAFENPSDSALHYSLFINYQVINRSELAYDSLYFGFFSDFDIGYHLDDYIGCDTLLQSYFGYNAYPVDGTGQPHAYGEHPPAQGVTFLNNPLSTFVYFNNTTGLPWYMTDPQVAIDYYNYMKAIWKDGTPMVYGGMGHPDAGGGTERAYHIFPGDLNNPDDWHEISAGNPPNDRRGLGSTYIGTFEPGQRICFDKAFVFGRNYQGDHISSVAVMKERIQQIRDFYTNNIMDDCSDLLVTNVYEVKAPISNLLRCFPNPVSQILTLEYSPQSFHASYRLYNAMGALLKAATVNTAITRIDVRQFKPGLYLLIVEDGGMLKHQKIIIR